MPKVISVDDLLEGLYWHPSNCFNYNEMCKLINKQPTLEIVCCGYCGYKRELTAEEKPLYIDGAIYCNRLDMAVSVSDYCSFGVNRWRKYQN